MSTGTIASVATVAVALIAAWAVPALGLKMLWPAFGAGDRAVVNYRGARISPGLGIAWLLWAMSVYVVVLKASTLQAIAMNSGVDEQVSVALSVWFPYAGAAMAAGGSFVFGLIDDAYGNAEARGFRGHLREMAGGTLTTGGLKLVGIGVVAAVAAVTARGIDLTGGAWAGATALGGWVLATLVIALAANLVNLTDLRPGRALKTYIVLAALGVGAASALPAPDRIRVLVAGDSPPLGAAVAGILLLGPAVAVWRYDLGERGMLGDAGANAMGALAGYVLASSLPLWGLAIAATLLLALNLASEKVSYSKVIEGNALLRWLDGIGRLREDGTTPAPAMAREGDEEHVESRKDGGGS